MPVITNWITGSDIELETPDRDPLDFSFAHAGIISPGDPEMISELPDGSTAIVRLRGELTKYDTLCRYGAMSYANLIRSLAMSKNIKNMVLDIDGPGGAVNGIAPILEAMNLFRRSGKSIGAHVDMAASAHYYLAVHADQVFLDNAVYSQVGSIGTMMQFADPKGYYEKNGIKIHTIYAPQSTHKNQEWEKALDGDYEPMKNNLLGPLAEKFQNAVRNARGSRLDESVDGILNGKMFFAEDAIRVGLADGMATLDEAVERVTDLAVINSFMNTN